MIYLVGGARPNFMKIAAISREFEKLNISYDIIHTGQHYDYNMDKIFFEEFGLKDPLVHLEVGSGPHGEQTAKIMERFERLCQDCRPAMVCCVGDVNSTMAVALVAAKMHIPIAHQEAGMRSFDKMMPEEVNRVVTDHISDLLFPISPQDRRNLYNEGITENVHLVGDPMIDNLLYYASDEESYDEKHFLVELHRPANVDNKNKLTEIVIAFSQLSERYHVVFPIHPRTRNKINDFGLWSYLDMVDCCPPMGYFDFHKYMKNAGCVITDSDGIQQETSILNVSCLAIRDTSNIQYTIDFGTCQLCEPDRDEIFNKAVVKFHSKEQNSFSAQLRELNDGKASERIARIIYEYFNYRFPTERDDTPTKAASITPTG